jgi:hypothetical protein
VTATVPPMAWMLFAQASSPSKADWLDIVNREALNA